VSAPFGKGSQGFGRHHSSQQVQISFKQLFCQEISEVIEKCALVKLDMPCSQQNIAALLGAISRASP
jgi:hypothetical protein